MNHIFLSIEILSLAVIVGGGIVLGGGLRPQFIKAMQQSNAVHELEALHINVWNAYNRFSLTAMIVFLLSQGISFFVTHQLHVFSFTLSVLLFLLFLFKLRIDAKLKKRALENKHAAESVEQKNDHKKVEYLSMVILLLSTIGLFFIQ